MNSLFGSSHLLEGGIGLLDRDDTSTSPHAINDVVVAESDAAPGEIQFSHQWTPEHLNLVITVPEGKTVDQIKGAGTDAALWRLSSRYTVTTRTRLKVPRRTFNELEGRYDPLEEFEVIDTVLRQKPASAPAKKAPTSPQSPPRASPPPVVSQSENTAPTRPAATIQFSTPPPIDLNLSPAAKYGKPKTEKEIGQEAINKIIVDTIAGRSDIPPLPTDLEPRSVVEAIKQGIADVVKPLIKGLPKEAQDYLLDKVDSAVEAGIRGIVDAVVDTAKLDDKTKAAIKKAVEAGIRLKPAPARPEQK